MRRSGSNAGIRLAFHMVLIRYEVGFVYSGGLDRTNVTAWATFSSTECARHICVQCGQLQRVAAGCM
jgi:hypothetical protein